MLADFFNKTPDLIREQELQDYFLHRKNVDKWSAATMRICYSGIKFFFVNVLKRQWHTLELVHAKREQRLPTVLSVKTVRRILNTVNTPQNKAYLTTVYSCGLRLQETLNLQVSDIDSERMRIHVHRGKGAKDRYVPLPEACLDILRSYWKLHRNATWIFPRLGRSSKEGPTATTPMNKASVQGALRRVLKQLKIKKRVSVHTLRHSGVYPPPADHSSVGSRRQHPPHPAVPWTSQPEHHHDLSAPDHSRSSKRLPYHQRADERR